MRGARTTLLVAIAIATGLVAPACATGAPTRTARSSPTSIVQLGDSIASGEGTLYGYTYDPGRRTWTGGNVDVVWPGPYPLCHDSPDAYGTRVADHDHAQLHQFACTGATFTNGIAAPETRGFSQYRPAQFGNWAAHKNLNAEYDTAAPDLVLVTLGADDLHFVEVVTACLENSYEHLLHVATLACVTGNPGPTVTTDFLNTIGTVKRNFGTLVDWIRARARARHAHQPTILFTTYPDPLPARGTQCPDTNQLDPAQLRYLSSLVTQLDHTIVSAVQSRHDPTVKVADLEHVYDVSGTSHRWCSPDPWAYGLSIFQVLTPSSFASQAPFHPTPVGQARIAERVLAALGS